jgi:hypothetical protein
MSILTATLIVLIQVASGSLLVLLIPASRIRSRFEIVGLGLALGTFISMLSSVLLVNTALHSIAWLLPAVVIVIATLSRFNYVRARMQQMTLPRNEAIAIVVGLLIGFALLAINWVRVPLSTIRAGGSVDMYFFEALARGVSEFGVSESILMSGGSLRYHWFSYGWAGELGQLANVESFVALTRILPVVALIGVVLLAAAWAGSIRIGKTKSPWWVPTLAVILIVFSGYTGALYGIVLNFDSPSQAFTTVWLLALVMLFLRGLRSATRAELFSYSALVVLMAGATTGGKASHVAVSLGGFALVSVLAVVLRQSWWRRALVLFIATIVGGGVVYVWALAGVGVEANLADSIAVRASTWQGLDPVAGKWGPMLGTIALLLAVLPRVIGVGWLASNRTGRTSPEFHFALGSLAVGVLALLVLRGGINELWFLLAASAPVIVISSYGIGQAQSWLRPRIQQALTSTVVIAALASLLSLVLSLNWKFDSQPINFFLWPGILYWLSVTGVWVLIVISSLLTTRRFPSKTPAWNRPSFVTAVFALSISALVLTSVFTRPAVLWTESRPLTTDIGVVTPNIEIGVTSPDTNAGGSLFIDLVSASEWLSANTHRSDQIATNVPGSSFIPASTGNQMYLAGSHYQAGLGDASQLSEVDRRGEVSALISMAALNDFSDETVLRELCESGVAYVWVEGPTNPSENQPVYSNETVSIYSLNKQCGEVANN